ncbi:AbfB domain-containing protein [Streptomyces graminilatus]|uniref:AbfB domain-containing protein n=1 Tax=Streptomyces graminilatus TaxID=1464070 RepID=UPI0006E1F7F0|nr:AbfB domain-containing protein [Streptomyces graminilatus]
MTEQKPRLTPSQPWENGWAPDTSRVPGTRRLWMAGTLALSVVAACVTAIVVSDRQAEDPAPVAKAPATSAGATYPGLLTYASPPSPGATPPDGKSGLASALSTGPTASDGTTPAAAPDVKGSATGPVKETPGGEPGGNPGGKPGGKPGTSPAPTKSSAAPSHQDPSLRSVESVNYPGRYWHVSGDLVKLDPVAGAASRKASTFSVVPGLYNSSCYSFKTRDGRYLRHRDFVLHADSSDGSSLFKQDATFCAGYAGSSGTVIQSSNYPNYALRHRDFQLRLDPYDGNPATRQDFSFRVVAPLG